MGSVATSILGVAKKERLMESKGNSNDQSNDGGSLHRDDFESLIARFYAVRREIDVRICIQSTIVLGTITLALILSVVIVILQSSGVMRVGLEVALLFACADLMAALHWMHSDIGHLRLGQYLMREVEPKLSRHSMGWERYHASLSRPTLFGSYYFVGTKGLLAAAPLLVTGASLTNRANLEEHGLLAVIFLLVAAIVVLTRLPRQSPPRIGRNDAA
jgi:ABC-type multidrug transport system fused ATPase/permease subunit